MPVSKPLNSGIASARIVCRMRSERKLKHTTTSPSRIGPTGVPARLVITTGGTNSSVVPDAYARSTAPTASVSVGPSPRTAAAYQRPVRSQRLSRSMP